MPFGLPPGRGARHASTRRRRAHTARGRAARGRLRTVRSRSSNRHDARPPPVAQVWPEEQRGAGPEREQLLAEHDERGQALVFDGGQPEQPLVLAGVDVVYGAAREEEAVHDRVSGRQKADGEDDPPGPAQPLVPRRIDELDPRERADEDERRVLELVRGLVAQGEVVRRRKVPAEDDEAPRREGDDRPQQEAKDSPQRRGGREAAPDGPREQEERQWTAERNERQGRRGVC